MRQKIYIVGTSAHSLINFRFELIKLLSLKFNVIALSRDVDKHVSLKLNSINVKHISYGNKKNSILSELSSIFFLFKLFSSSKNISVISYTLRANIFVGIASFIKKKIHHIPMITGFGGVYLSKHEGLKRYLIYKFIFFILKIIFFKSKKVIFQNRDDKKFFEKKNKNPKFFTILGSGVDTKFFNKAKFPEKLTFMMISRLIKYKGIESFMKTATIIKKKYPKTEFILVGKKQREFSLDNKIIVKALKNGAIKLFSWKKNSKSLFNKCSIYILPSKREGLSRSILEAMSCGKPIITSNVPGCRQTIINNYNGFLVKYNDHLSLIIAVEKFIKKKILIKKFGNNSRKRAVKYFDVKNINKKILKIIQIKL